MLHNPIPHAAWPYQPHPHSHGASPSTRARAAARWHPYDSGNGTNPILVGERDERSASPGVKRRLHITIPKPSRSRSLTDIQSSSALAPSPLRRCAAYDEAGLPVPVSARVGPMYEPLEAVPRPGMQTTQSMTYPTATPYPIQTPSTARQGYLQTPPTIATRSLHSPAVTPVTSIMVTPASASTISPVSPIRARFGFPMTHAPSIAAFGEGTSFAREFEAEMEEDIEDADVRTEVGSPEMGFEEELRLPPIRTLPPIQSYGSETVSIGEQTRRAMRGGGAISRDVLLYGPAGVTPAPAELARNNACDKLPPVPSCVPPRQATFFGVQSAPVADGSGRFATICAPPRRGVPAPASSRPVYPPAGIAPLIAGHQGLPHGGLTAPIERGDQVAEWKEQQRAKERADIVVKDGELSQAEKLEMEKRVSMSVKVINHIYYGADDIPKARSPTQTTRRLPDEQSSSDNVAAGPSASRMTQTAGAMYCPPTPASMPSSPESPKTRRERQRASMRKDVLGEQAAKATVEVEDDPSREPPARTLTWFVTEVLRRSRTSINVLQVALAYLAGAKPEIHNQLRIAADRQAELAIQIAGIPQEVRDALPGMDWLSSEFTPSPLIDPRRTFLASLVLASKFLLDKAFSNKAWAKLSGLEALEVGKCERALGTALNWRLWVGREASRECVAPAPNTHNYPSPAHSTLTMSPPSVFARSRSGGWENPTLSSLRENASPARSSSPLSTVFTQGSTPSLALSETSSESDAPHGYDELSAWIPTPEMVSEPEEMLHGSPAGYPSAAMGGSMRIASEPVVHTRPVLPPFRSFDRPALRRGPAEMITPQTDSNLGCVHMPPVCFERASNESPLAYTDFARPWEAMSGQAHWDFDQGGVVTV